MSSSQPARFDDLAIGQDWGVHTWIASPDFCARWSAIVGDVAPTEGPSDPAGATARPPAVPPSLAFLFVAEAVNALMPRRPAGGVHAKQQFTFRKPMIQGDRLSTRVVISDKFVRRGRRYVELTTTTLNQDGETVLTGVRSTVWAA